MNQDEKCSICGFVVHHDDELKNHKKKRHEGKHSYRYNPSKKTIHVNNNSIGKVEWIKIW